jgi:hypothetical protein
MRPHLGGNLVDSDIKVICSGGIDSRVVVGLTEHISHRGESPKFLENAMIRRSRKQIRHEWDGRSAEKDFWAEAEEKIEKRKRRGVDPSR